MEELPHGDLRFSTGKTLSPNRGIVGISPDLEVFDGYDGRVTGEYRNDGDLTTAELIELADHIIARWQSFKAMRLSLAQPPVPTAAGS